ncbi:MAG: autotransporter outer membrane beta-barrel domain-containing protein [Bradyrhizobium sp.]|uniref:autotransporter outer membrane beta-barrel domain-containing protein n=1 Tax=Bradyrhizobium sp. TaxID=376 RepID=UPI003BF3EDC2
MPTSDLSRVASRLSSRAFGIRSALPAGFGSRGWISPVRCLAMVAAASAAMTLLSAPAQAACTPVAANDASATCTGVTTDQNGTNGYGSGAIDNLSVTVVQGASVTGTSYGIRFNTGTVVNSGTITGINDRGIFGATSANVTNFGTISGYLGVDTGGNGVVTNFGAISGTTSDGVRGTTITVVNSGTITAAYDGVFAIGTSTVVNSGSITGNSHGVYALADISVDNSGSIASVGGAIYAPNGSATVVNSGTIAMTDTFGSVMYALTNLTLINSGIVTSTSVGPSSSGTIDVTNSGSILNNGFGPAISGTVAKVTNSGIIIAVDGAAVSASNVTVTNSGLIRGYWEGIGSQYATVTNSGTIIGEHSAGVQASFDVIVTNSGAITGSGAGIRTFNGSINTVNFGTITGKGPSGIGILSGTTGTVVNSGTIIGEGGTAIQFGATTPAQSDSLTVLPGARFGGVVDFTGGADTVTFGLGSWILNTANFDKTLSTVTTAGNPYVVTSNQIIVADLSSFGAQNRAIMDITGWIGSVLPDAPVFATGAATASAFAAPEPAASPFDAFASFPSGALGYAPTPAFKGASTNYGDGNVVWAKAFGGQRLQDNSGALIGGTTTGYGGAVGYERLISSDLRLGMLAGGSSNKTNLYFNAGSTSTDAVFGGAYGRKTWGGTFLDLSVIGGSLDNSSVRNIGGGLAFATATASYGGWFVNPALMFGRRLDVDGRGFTVTPAVKVRYVAARFGGYAETGAGAANLSAAGRDFQAWEERAEITFANTRTLANGNRVTTRVAAGALAQQRSAGGLLDVVLLGQNFIVATPERSSVAGGYSSAGVDWQMGRLTLFAAGEATYTSDVSRTYSGKAGARVSW